MTYGIEDILHVLFPSIHLHLNWITNIILFFYWLYDQHIATFISSCYGDLYVIVVLRVAYHHCIWVLHYSLLIARYQILLFYPSLLCLGTSREWWSYLLILDALSNH